MTGGILYEKINDTVRSNKYFNKSLTMCNIVLDTMNTINGDFYLLVINKALNLIMLGKHKEGNELLQKLYAKQTDSALQKRILSVMKKSKKDLVESMTKSHHRH